MLQFPTFEIKEIGQSIGKHRAGAPSHAVPHRLLGVHSPRVVSLGRTGPYKHARLRTPNTGGTGTYKKSYVRSIFEVLNRINETPGKGYW